MLCASNEDEIGVSEEKVLHRNSHMAPNCSRRGARTTDVGGAMIPQQELVQKLTEDGIAVKI